MSILKNPRHEKFAQELVAGKSASEAYVLAGFNKNDGNCIRLKGNERVQARLAELQAEVAQESKITVAGLLSELEDARRRATDLEQLSAAVRAIESKAKISGLLAPQKIEVGGAGAFDQCNSTEEVVDGLLQLSAVNHYHDLRNEDRDHLVALFQRFFEAADEYIEAIKARPFRSARDEPKQLPRLNARQKRP